MGINHYKIPRSSQSKEEFMAEYDRWNALTPEEQEAEWQEYMDDCRKRRKEWEEEQRRLHPKPTIEDFKNYDHPNSLENDEATVLWIIVMAIATIFKGNWIIWIIATIVWIRYMNRHQR